MSRPRLDPRHYRIRRCQQGFSKLVTERDMVGLDNWLGEALGSDLASLIGFANGILAYQAALQAALTLPWSNGILEGHVNRVKLIKRIGYGRASFDLLGRRVLAA